MGTRHDEMHSSTRFYKNLKVEIQGDTEFVVGAGEIVGLDLKRME